MEALRPSMLTHSLARDANAGSAGAQSRDARGEHAVTSAVTASDPITHAPEVAQWYQTSLHGPLNLTGTFIVLPRPDSSAAQSWMKAIGTGDDVGLGLRYQSHARPYTLPLALAACLLDELDLRKV